MSHKLIDIVESKCLKRQIPEFHVGDTVDVSTRIREGAKERTQVFNGVVIARGGRGINERFTVRRIVNNEGVERLFMVHSPMVLNVGVKRRGKVRRAKLYFLRDRVGKARRLRELRIRKSKQDKESSASAGSAESEPQLVGAS
ncbi:MAG: 50S ribosomal protein L19 [Phycisphaerae bacterium]